MLQLHHQFHDVAKLKWLVSSSPPSHWCSWALCGYCATLHPHLLFRCRSLDCRHQHWHDSHAIMFPSLLIATLVPLDCCSVKRWVRMRKKSKQKYFLVVLLQLAHLGISFADSTSTGTWKTIVLKGTNKKERGRKKNYWKHSLCCVGHINMNFLTNPTHPSFPNPPQNHLAVVWKGGGRERGTKFYFFSAFSVLLTICSWCEWIPFWYSNRDGWFIKCGRADDESIREWCGRFAGEM